MKKLWLILILSLSLFLLSVIFFKEDDRNKLQDTSFPAPTLIQSPRKEPLKVKVSIPYWDQERAVKSFKENVEKVNIVSLFWYFLDTNGKIKKYQDAKEDRVLIDFAKANNVKVEVVITNLPEDGSWDSVRVEKILKNDNLRKKHIDEIVELTRKLNLDGVDIDYEQLDTNLMNNFSAFIKDLGKALDTQDKYLGVALHPKSADGTIGEQNGAKAQDWEELAKGADNLYIMAFGEHWDEGESGPIASFPWVERIVGYAESFGIQEKLFLVIPLYGYSWQAESDERATGLTYSDIAKVIQKNQITFEWDETAQSPHFHYDSQGESYEVWFENAQSVAEKIKLAKRFAFSGISFWRLGGEDPNIWPIVRQYR